MDRKRLNRIENILFGIVLLIGVVSLLLAVAEWMGGCMVCLYPCHKCHKFKRLEEMWRTGDHDSLCIQCYLDKEGKDK